MRQHLDLAADPRLLLFGAFGPRRAPPRDLDAELVAQSLGDVERLGAIRVADDLHETFAVAQVDEDDAAMVAAAMHPAGERHGLGKMAAVDTAAIIGSFHEQLQQGNGRGETVSWWRSGTAARARPR